MFREIRDFNRWGEEGRTGLHHLPGAQACTRSPACKRSFQQGRKGNRGLGGGHLAQAVVRLQRDERMSACSQDLPQPAPTPAGPLSRPLGALAQRTGCLSRPPTFRAQARSEQ